jgi:antitoxin ParD1/3/4
MPTRNVVPTERQEELIETLVKSGRYQNASEVLRDGLQAAARVGVGALDRDEKIQHFRGAASLFEMRFRRRSSQEQPNRGPLWSSGNGTSSSVPPQNSTLRISSNGSVRILVRDNRVSAATPSLRRSANWPRVPCRGL